MNVPIQDGNFLLLLLDSIQKQQGGGKQPHFQQNKETDIICRLKIHIRTAKSNYDCRPKPKQEGVKCSRSHLRGSMEQGRQPGAQLDGSRVRKVPAKIRSQNELWAQMRKCELAKHRKKAEAKPKTP